MAIDMTAIDAEIGRLIRAQMRREREAEKFIRETAREEEDAAILGFLMLL